MTALLKQITESSLFQNVIIGVIILAGLLVGLETSPAIVEQHGPLLHLLDQIVLGIFIVEILLKTGAQGRRPWRFFADGWNVFDFLIVVACLLPVAGQHVAVLRLLRLLRVLRLVRALPRLQVLVSALFKSIPSMGYVGLLLLLHFYLFGVAASFLFAENDPIHFSSLPLAMLSLFRAVTLEDWTDLMYIQMYGCANYGYSGSEALCTASQAQPVLGAVFFVVFVLLGTMIILNLFIGVIMNGMNDARAENEAEARARARAENEPSLDDDFKTLTEQLASLQQQLGTLQQRVALSAKRRQAEISTSEAA